MHTYIHIHILLHLLHCSASPFDADCSDLVPEAQSVNFREFLRRKLWAIVWHFVLKKACLLT